MEQQNNKRAALRRSHSGIYFSARFSVITKHQGDEDPSETITHNPIFKPRASLVEVELNNYSLLTAK
jgi:hypothetical protein